MTLNQVITALVILGVTLIAAKVVDTILLRRGRGRLPPGALTRYTALRHVITAAILVIGGASALFVFPSVRGVGAAILSSAAFLTIIIGLAAQASLSNFISGLVISFAQPIRIGDQIEFRGINGIVDDVSRTYTRIRTQDGAWQLIPEQPSGFGHDPQLDDREPGVHRVDSGGGSGDRRPGARHGGC